MTGAFSWTSHEDRGVTVLAPAGVLSVTSYPVLRSLLLKAAADVPRGVVVDLDGVEVPLTSTLSIFPWAAACLDRWPGIPLVLASGREPLATQLRAGAVPRFVAVHRGVDAAVDAVGTAATRRRAVLDLATDPAEAVRARTWLRELGARWGLADLDDAVLVMSELVENMVRHTGGPGRLRVELSGTDVSIAVSDESLRPPRFVPAAEATGAGGRGIAVVDALSRAWGHNPRHGGGKVVWAVVPVRRVGDCGPEQRV